jgi:cell wall-associated NlpC family hydrolase
MFKKKIPAIIPMAFGVVFLSSCSTFKSLNIGSRQVSSVSNPNLQTRFIDDISITPQASSDKTELRTVSKETYTTSGMSVAETQVVSEGAKRLTENVTSHAKAIESATPVQLKYAALLKVDVESLPNKTLLEGVDKYYGVRYVYGGSSRNGIDCSGFTCNVFSEVYGINLPRVSRDQYNFSRKISTTELMEGDLLFFNTLGSGVSHVAIYLGNNKFIHATVNKGIMVSDLYESYYIKRFVGAGRIDNKQLVASK